MTLEELGSLRETAETALASIDAQARSLLQERFADQPSEAYSNYLSSVRGAIYRVVDALNGLRNSTDGAYRLVEMTTPLADEPNYHDFLYARPRKIA